MVASPSGISSMSIGLVDVEAVYSRDEEGTLRRLVTRADVDHITICDVGAYASACCWLSKMPWIA
jgi:hypothetical protein